LNTDYQVLLTHTLPTLTDKVLQIKRSSADCINRPGVGMMLFMIFLFVSTIGFTTPAVHAAKLLFKSNFGSGVSLGMPTKFYSNGSGTGAWQSITGTDKETGYTWPITALGATFSGVQLIVIDPVTSSTIGNYISNEIRSVTGPNGKPINGLYQNVKIKGPVGQAGSQDSLLIQRPWTIGDVNDLYITYWFKYPADLASKLDSTVSSGNWRMQSGFKTGGYNNTHAGDYRIETHVMKGVDGVLYWMTKADNVANGPWPRVDYWRENNYAVPVPLDTWFKYEVYWHRSSGSDGRYWAAVNGEVIVDHYGPNMGDYNLPITRIFVNNSYSGGYATVESHSTGLEIWNGFPCGAGVSCYDYDISPPSVPTSLALKISKYTSSAMVSLSWEASSDSVGVTGYNIYRNGKKIGVTTSIDTNFSDSLSGAATGILHSYTVKALDAAGNLSAASSVASVIY
jgi:hypothetical protein